MPITYVCCYCDEKFPTNEELTTHHTVCEVRAGMSTLAQALMGVTSLLEETCCGAGSKEARTATLIAWYLESGEVGIEDLAAELIKVPAIREALEREGTNDEEN